ncbi:MAG TPA: ABC transporter permease [Chitinophaga sp.]
MFKTYLKVTWRNIWKSKLMTGVNLLGLTVAFAAALLLGMTVYFELSYDGFHANRNTIFQVYRSVNYKEKVRNISNMPIPLLPALTAEAPHVKAASRMNSQNGVLRYGDKQLEEGVSYVDADFLRMFSFPVIAGSATPLRNLSDMVLTEKMAKALFGTVQPVGKTVQVNTDGAWKSFQVTAVVKDVPDNSSLQFSCLQRYENYPGYDHNKSEWDNYVTNQYIQLDNPAAAATFGEQVQPLVNKYFASQIADYKQDGSLPDAHGNVLRLDVVPLREVHFNPITGGGGKAFVYLLMIITFFILFIAATNFVNIALARAFSRGREIGIRKVMGAVQRQLVWQFWSEALLQCLFALALGAGLAYLLLRGYNALFRSDLSFQLLRDPLLLACTVAAFILVTVVAGGYPAWRMARLNTLLVLKGKMSLGKGNRLRNSLIVGQFTIAAALICCTLIAEQQVYFLRNKPLGFNKSEVISIPLGANVQPVQTIRLLRDKLSGESSVESIGATDINMGRGNDGSMAFASVSFTMDNHLVSASWRNVDYGYCRTLGLKFVAGRDFSPNFPTDSNALVINEAMARVLGGVSAAVGKLLPVEEHHAPMQVIGVVRDFNFESLQKEIGPLSLTIKNPETLSYVFVKVAPGNLPAAMAVVQKAWEQILPNKPFLGSFLDVNTERQYRRESRFTSIFISSAILAIVIACMGLFAIAIMAMLQRTREIGIRKVLGASVRSIVALLSGDFLKLVALAIVMAVPISWWAMSRWLADYAYRIRLEAWTFVAAGALAVGIAFLTISFNAVRAALANPVKSLRNE